MVCFKLGKSVKEIHNEFTSAYPDSTPLYITVWRWINLFKYGMKDLEDQDRPGALVTTTMPQNIQTVQQLVDNDPHISLHQLEAQNRCPTVPSKESFTSKSKSCSLLPAEFGQIQLR